MAASAGAGNAVTGGSTRTSPSVAAGRSCTSASANQALSNFGACSLVFGSFAPPWQEAKLVNMIRTTPHVNQLAHLSYRFLFVSSPTSRICS